MRRRSILLPIALLALATIACTLAGGPTPVAPDNTQVTVEATLPPIAPGTFVPTRSQPTSTPLLQATSLPSLTPSSTAVRPKQPPVLSGPVDFSIGILKCRLDPSRQGGVILTMRFDARGGNGVYTYYRENNRVPRQFDRPATKGTAVIDSFRVESGDGQQVERKERFTGNQFGCP